MRLGGSTRPHPHFSATLPVTDIEKLSHNPAALIYFDIAYFDPCFSCMCNFVTSNLVNEDCFAVDNVFQHVSNILSEQPAVGLIESFEW